MKAFLLAGGYGTRLRPITDEIPKCLVPIAGKPLIDYWLQQLVEDAGCDEILINTHYLSEQVNKHIADSKYRELISLTHEEQLLGTLGSICANVDFLEGDNFILAHADNLCLVDWQAFLSHFDNRPKSCDMTMMLFHTDSPESCGMVDLSVDGVLQGYMEKPKGRWYGTLANAAVFIMSQSTLSDLRQSPKEHNDLCGDFLPHRLGKVNGFVNQDLLIDIGTPLRLEKARQLMTTRLKEYS